jgi:hypothetical protein
MVFHLIFFVSQISFSAGYFIRDKIQCVLVLENVIMESEQNFYSAEHKVITDSVFCFRHYM